MQPFRIRSDARDWFKELRGEKKGFKTDFDAFYFCFITGVIMKRKRDIPSDKTAELINYFPTDYKNRGKLLIGLFLKSEMEVLGVSMDKRSEVDKQIKHLVTHESPSSLTSKGVQEFNKYAHGGYEQLVEWFNDYPRSLETFLQQFKQEVDNQLAEKKSCVSK